jgi:ABC-type transporter Mla subunit MlaD
MVPIRCCRENDVLGFKECAMKCIAYVGLALLGAASFALGPKASNAGPLQDTSPRDERDIETEIDERYQRLEDKLEYETSVSRELEVVEEVIEEIASTPELETTDALAELDETVASLERLLAQAREDLDRLTAAEGRSWHLVRSTLQQRLGSLDEALAVARTRFGA